MRSAVISEFIGNAVVARARQIGVLERPAIYCRVAKIYNGGILLSYSPNTMDNTLMNDGVLEALAFKLGNEEYGIKILQVQEIRGYESVTRIASAPEHVKGVVNLRGTIVPIVDMRIKFKLGEPTYNQFTVVIILNIQDRVVGMVVDSVSDVISLTADQIKPAPDMGALNTDYVVGLGTVDERMIILVDIDRLMSSDDMGVIDSAAAA
jgi:purine-binding chemotaxis protein CheW